MARRDHRIDIRDQYRDSSNLGARIELHGRFSTAPESWQEWMFGRLDLPAECRLLEVGCGTGALWRENAERMPPGWRLTATDMSRGMLADAAAALPEGAQRCAADACRLPFRTGTFDAVLANHMLYHVADIDQALREISRVLPPGGRLYAATNGLEHMVELRDLVREFAPHIPFSTNVAEAFSLDNGAEMIGRHFAEVRVHRHDNELAVTEVEPLVAYVRSTMGARAQLDDDQCERLADALREMLAAEGVIRISKAGGVFEARKPQ